MISPNIIYQIVKLGYEIRFVSRLSLDNKSIIVECFVIDSDSKVLVMKTPLNSDDYSFDFHSFGYHLEGVLITLLSIKSRENLLKNQDPQHISEIVNRLQKEVENV